MRIGVVTFHHSINSYGACLQAYATVSTLRDMGYEAELINYENYYEQRVFKDRSKPLLSKLYIRVNWFARMFLFGGWKSPKVQKRELDNIYGGVTEIYHSVREMNGLQYDVLLVGSDQVWNPEISGYLDPVYLLEFGSAKRRISYASSMGSYTLTANEAKHFSEALSNYFAISVRETFAKKQLQPLSDKHIDVVLDPTLLLSREQWAAKMSIQKEHSSNAYILTYFIGSSIEKLWDKVEPYAKALSLPIHNIQTHKRKSMHVDYVLCNMTLNEMLNSIENAALVITDSFHGTAFSVNLGKQFVVIPNVKNPLRVENLLSILGLSERILPDINAAMQPLDWNGINARLDELRNESIDWLQHAVSGCDEYVGGDA